MTLLLVNFFKHLIPYTEGRMNKWFTPRKFYSHNDAPHSHQSKSSSSGWRHKFFRHCCLSSAKGYINTISVCCLPRLRSSNIDRSNRRKWLYTKKARSRQYPAETITGADYADDITLLANTPTQAESQLEQAALASE